MNRTHRRWLLLTLLLCVLTPLSCALDFPALPAVCEAISEDDLTCDGVDDDCNGVIDDGWLTPHQGCELPTLGEVTCQQGEVFCEGIPTSSLAGVPGMPCEETDWSGLQDIDWRFSELEPPSGWWICHAGHDPGVSCNDDTDCDGLDNDCDGQTDEGYLPMVWWDVDTAPGCDLLAGPMNCLDGQERCGDALLSQETYPGHDCTAGGVSGAWACREEGLICVLDLTCDGGDDDCDGSIDEDWSTPKPPCDDRPGAQDQIGPVQCEGGVVTCGGEAVGSFGDAVSDFWSQCELEVEAPGSRETSLLEGYWWCLPDGGVICHVDDTCDGVDDECDGFTDEDALPPLVTVPDSVCGTSPCGNPPQDACCISSECQPSVASPHPWQVTGTALTITISDGFVIVTDGATAHAETAITLVLEDEGTLIGRNYVDSAWAGWGRLDWAGDDAGPLRLCQTVSDAATEAEALAAPPADAGDLDGAGCGGGPWMTLLSGGP